MPWRRKPDAPIKLNDGPKLVTRADVRINSSRRLEPRRLAVPEFDARLFKRSLYSRNSKARRSAFFALLDIGDGLSGHISLKGQRHLRPAEQLPGRLDLLAGDDHSSFEELS